MKYSFLTNKWFLTLSLFVGFLFFLKTMKQNKVIIAETVENKAIRIFNDANAIANGDSNRVFSKHLSKAMALKISQLLVLEKYLIAKGTKNGRLLKVETMSKKIIKKDSVLLNMKLTFNDHTVQNIEQVLVLENKQWLIGLSFAK
jgi:hypothetical protein